MAAYFKFLDRLRDMGSVNMHGAAPNLMKVFGITQTEAMSVLNLWIDTFDDAKTPEERAAQCEA
jgi:hypothetical protein